MDFASPSHSPTIEHAVEEAIDRVHLYPEIPPASHHKGSPSERSDERSSSGSDGDEQYHSTQFGEPSSDEVDGLHLESEE